MMKKRHLRSDSVVESAEREIPARRGESREPAPFNEYVQIFTEAEKTLELRGRFFHKLELVGADLSSADFTMARFEGCSLTGCDLSGSTLRGVEFVDTTIRCGRLAGAVFGRNRFDGVVFESPEGLTADQVRYIARRGGSIS
jgi:uncharacterized protein YjbI with pentapeptide repeats